MLYLIGQIVFCLLLAAILGFIIGWYSRGRSSQKAQLEQENDLTVKIDVKTEPKKAAVKTDEGKKGSAKGTLKKDDLKKIRGIGPVLEKRLNRMGIERFDQIARFSGQDILKISAKIGAFPDRIERDRWVSQAKKLQNK